MTSLGKVHSRPLGTVVAEQAKDVITAKSHDSSPQEVLSNVEFQPSPPRARQSTPAYLPAQSPSANGGYVVPEREAGRTLDAPEEEETLYDLSEDEQSPQAKEGGKRVESKVNSSESDSSQLPADDSQEHAQLLPAAEILVPTVETSVPAVPYIENDPVMASLADHVGRAMAFDAAPKTNIQIPRGYIFDFEVSGSEFWRAHAMGPRGTKRKHEIEEPVQRHGFLAEDVIRLGAIQMPGARLPSLTNDIHPLFQRDAFDGCEDDVYDQLTPALRLASMFLTHSTCSKFWVTLAWGQRFVDHTMTSRMGRLQHRIPKDVELTQENANKVMEYIKGIAQEYRVHFSFVQRMMADGVKWAGITQKVENFCCDVGWSPNHKPNSTQPELLRIHTRLSSDWYVAAKKLTRLKFPDAAQLLRFNFGFAVLITHEMCHAIELAHIRTRPDWVPDSSWNPELQQEIGHEPFFHDNHVPELGYTWEKYVFGGKIWPINDRMDCLHGLCITNWPITSSDIWDSSKIEYYTIPMRFIEPLFQMRTWEQDFEISDTKTWHISRDGAKSIYLPGFTTMDSNEEQRIRDEEQAELAARLESKEPASKRRKTNNNEEGNDVPLSSTGEEALLIDLPALRKQPTKNTDRKKPKVPLAQRQMKKPTTRRKKNSGRGKGAASSGDRTESAENAAKRVALGTGKKR